MTIAPSSRKQMLERVDSAIDRHFDSSVDLLVSLVQERSTLGNTNSAQDVLFRACSQLGLETHREPVMRDGVIRDGRYAPGSGPSAASYNVVAVLPATMPRPDTEPVVLNGHIDVVPADPESWWMYDPWGAHLRDGRLYGRGALDMKSGLAAALLAMQAVAESGMERAAHVVLESVVEEECTGNGMLARRLAQGRIGAAVILEPTDHRLWCATPGVIWFEVLVTGRPAYVGSAGEYVNAIQTAASLIDRLLPRIASDLNERFDDPRFAHLGRPLTASVGTIEGGSWTSSVPLECRFTCRMSYPTSWTVEEAMSFVNEQVTKASESDAWLEAHPPQMGFPGFRASPWNGSRRGALHASIQTSHRDVFGAPLVEGVFPGTADARYFSVDEEVLYYGPSGGNIHAPDEFVYIESVRQVARVVARLITEYQDPA